LRAEAGDLSHHLGGDDEVAEVGHGQGIVDLAGSLELVQIDLVDLEGNPRAFRVLVHDVGVQRPDLLGGALLPRHVGVLVLSDPGRSRSTAFSLPEFRLFGSLIEVVLFQGSHLFG
jgi:hypothetical protein